MKSDYCFDAVHRPVQPSDRTNVPEPLRPEKRPVLFQLKPETDPPDVVEPFGLTWPELSSPEILPLADDKSLGGGAASRAHGMGHPGAVEIAASAATFARSAAWLFGLGLASSRRLFSFDRSRRLPRTGH